MLGDIHASRIIRVCHFNAPFAMVEVLSFVLQLVNDLNFVEKSRFPWPAMLNSIQFHWHGMHLVTDAHELEAF